MGTLVNPYCTVTDVTRFLGNSNADSDRISDAINRASRFIDELTGKIFYKKTLTDYYIKGTGGGEGWDIRNLIPGHPGGGRIISPWRIISITSISEDGVALVENDDFFVINEEGAIERYFSNWSMEPRGIKISGTFGYDAASSEEPAADQPQDIAVFAIEIAARLSGLYTKNIEQADGTIVSIDNRDIPKWIVDRIMAKAGIL